MTELLLGAQRALVCSFARRMAADGLVVGTAGNLSVRSGDLIAVTPTGVDYAGLEPASIPVVRPDGSPADGALLPTSELAMHLAVYGSTGAGAVVHTHAVAATALSTLVTEVPSIHYAVAAFGGPVRVAEYATYGTPELAASALRALAGRTGCLLANHGTLTHGPDLATAYDRTRQLDWLCQVHLAARAAGTPRLLPPEEIDRVAAKLRTYGQAR